jgi:hypothetical protein
MNQISIKIFIAIISVPILVISFLIALEIRESLNCKTVKSERNASNQKVLSYEATALKEWNSFPIYAGALEGRDPTPGSGGQIFSNFEEYFQSFYYSKVQKEKEVGYRLVLNYPECFTLREVVEIQEILRD